MRFSDSKTAVLGLRSADTRSADDKGAIISDNGGFT